MGSFKSNLKKANFHRCTRATSIELNKQLAVYLDMPRSPSVCVNDVESVAAIFPVLE